MLTRLLLTFAFISGLGLAALGLASLWWDIDHGREISGTHWVRAGLDDGNVLLIDAQRSNVARFRRDLTLFRGRLGVLGLRQGAGGGWRWRSFSVPLWMVVGLLFVAPAVGFYRGPLRRRYRRRNNLCLACGYDLAGTISDRCSECGAPCSPQSRSLLALRDQRRPPT